MNRSWQELSTWDWDPDLFIEFVNLVYRSKIFENETYLGRIELIRLWVLSSELGAFLLQKIVIDRYKEKYNRDKSTMGADTIDYAYENTTMDAGLPRPEASMLSQDMS